MAVTISILALLVTFTGANYQSITSYFSSVFFPKSDYTINSLSSPVGLPFDLFSLAPSPDYYVSISLQFRTTTQYIGDPFQFSVSFNNMGKRIVDQPNITIYFADMDHREWGVWNKSLTHEEFLKGFSAEYHFPSLDQKSIGAWIVTAVLYDNATGELVSYNASEFLTTDTAPLPAWLVDLVGIVLIAAAIGAFVTFRWRIHRDKIKAQARKARREEKQAEKSKQEGKENNAMMAAR